ncbi:MAG: hypothetical protein A2782_00295 [Candidatus Blackburnbacteria bacterium RIFCSPHIGHO2_01_FULL_43_15b]|uniref:Uncharacterized protein n=1 Tax=Candidatus Blackburnbacteria bacterium RIFCSPHIGHO2_01_FULL_43_15b TaxID=1797513 RepID=A0A1G1UYQ1_9BACT|nr:MAG: hypothetical protein A2782_00295 [Candidatus Blackburnbacteria bacterium RIFCSPHIGHO2_01_FULL_43_15b]
MLWVVVAVVTALFGGFAWLMAGDPEHDDLVLTGLVLVVGLASLYAQWRIAHCGEKKPRSRFSTLSVEHMRKVHLRSQKAA